MSTKKYPQEEIQKFKTLLEEETPFAFVRFSDGELTVLQNKYLQLAQDKFIQGANSGPGIYPPEEQKLFDPANPIHAVSRLRLVDSLRYKAPNYFKGICTRSDVTDEDFKFQLELADCEEDDPSLTFANVFINANYPYYLKNILPLLQARPVILIVNESADPYFYKTFSIEEDFRVGTNCFINNLNIVDEVKDYLSKKDNNSSIILCSAASLSNIIIHECYKDFPKHTYLDIGSSLNPFFKMEGWVHSRGYLQHYWLGRKNRFGVQVDEW